MKRYAVMGLMAIAGSIAGTVLGILLKPGSAAIWAAIGTALGTGVGLLFASMSTMKSPSETGSCRSCSSGDKDNN